MNMRIGHLLVASALGVTMGVDERHSVAIGEAEAPVARAADDGLDGRVSRGVALGVRSALAGCAPWDVRETCCAAGCAAKNGPQWPKADEILRGCMRGLGCSESEVRGASVFMRCDCPKK